MGHSYQGRLSEGFYPLTFFFSFFWRLRCFLMLCTDCEAHWGIVMYSSGLSNYSWINKENWDTETRFNVSNWTRLFGKSCAIVHACKKHRGTVKHINPCHILPDGGWTGGQQPLSLRCRLRKPSGTDRVWSDAVKKFKPMLPSIRKIKTKFYQHFQSFSTDFYTYFPVNGYSNVAV